MFENVTDEEYEELYPAECHFKVIAVDLEGVHKQLNQTLVDLGFEDIAFQPGNRSAKGKYITYEIRILVETRQLMYEIDAALKSVGGVKMVL